MSEHHDESYEATVNRGKVVAGALAGFGALSLPKFLRPSEALAAGDGAALDEASALFLGQKDLPVPPKNAKVHTSACQYCNVGCGYKIYTWPGAKTPQQLGEPTGARSDWISAAMVTRAQVKGKDSYVAVVPDRDCVVNRGDHSPRGGTNALTIYTKRQHPLTHPTERHLYP